MNKFLKLYAPMAFNEGLDKCNKLGMSLVIDKRAKKLLDLGCGGGKLTVQFAKTIHAKELYSLEFKDENIEEATQRNNLYKS